MLKVESTKIIKFGKKVGEQKIDEILNSFYNYFIKDTEKDNNYKFDFSDVEWIDNQGILVVTGLLKYLVELEVSFKFNFLKDGSSELTDKRKAKQFVEVWEIWKIYQIAPNLQYDKYFDIDGNFIEGLKKRFKIKIANQEIYDRYGVTPFLALDKIEKYEDRKIGEMLSNIYNLNDATNDILIKNHCYLPFENETISSIITKELYENFLDHFKSSIFSNKNDYAFMSLSLKRKMSIAPNSGKVQFLLNQNFEDESMPELKNFYFNSSKGKYKNQSLLQISFLDFGQGIPNTLSRSYENSNNKSFSPDSAERNLDSKILEYAFMPNSSQHEVYERYSSAFIVPRGLFDLLSIVKRFEGLVVARSNHGKIAFDFSENKSFLNSICNFGDNKNFFPGTLISIYIPERNLQNKFDYSSIKPSLEEPIFNFKSINNRYISLFEIQKKIKTSYSFKEDIYNNLFKNLVDEFKDSKENLIYVDFKGYEIDERITKKIIYFLCSDYGINSSKNIIVINPPPLQFLENIKDEIADLSTIEKQFTFHPTPFVYVNLYKKNVEIFWLGVYSNRDIDKLNELLYESHNLTEGDFENPYDVVGHINKYDKHGNLISIINSSQIIDFYKEKILQSRNHELVTLISPNIKKEDGSIFLCNGNYYQYEYLQLFDILNNKDTLDYLSNELFQELTNAIDEIENYIFVGITASSQKIIQSFIDNNQILPEKCVLLNNYFSFEKEQKFITSFKKDDEIILICDVISTGYMVTKLEKHLNTYNSKLKHIGVLIDAIDTNFKNVDYSDIKDKLITIYPYEMKKFQRSDISQLLQEKKLKVVRINPFTNTPITQSIVNTNYKTSVLLENKDFLELIDPKYINVGYFNFNNLIHPYFFDMERILNDSSNSEILLHRLFEKLGMHIPVNEFEVIFYPKNSGIQHINFKFLKDTILKNHTVEIYELERFPTNEGWRFSHPPQSLINNSRDKNVLILDDGSCSGESILQMIDEVAFLEVKKITVLSIIGRVNEHKREFFSRIKSINNNITNVEINIFFGSHWHIPTYYLSKSPVVAERYWLKKLVEFPNTPQSIKKIASGVTQELKAKNISDGNNTHLLKNKIGENVFDDLIIVRDHFGKITDFRFYKEYFQHFDEFISHYESKNKAIRGKFPYQLIELYGGILIHEPYLFDNLKMIVPDIVEKIQEFVLKLFWNEPKIKRSDLCYKWDNKNLFHLIFIVFREDKLFEVLNSTNLSTLMNFVETQSDLDYILFKMSYYLDINTEKRIKDTSINQSEIKNLINVLLENNNIQDWKLRKLKRYRAFVSTLIDNNESFKAKLALVKHNYDKITDDQFHHESISTQFGILNIQLESLSQDYEDETEKIILDAWDKINAFLTEFLSFTITYPHFLSSFGTNIYETVEGNTDSLRIIQGRLSDKIYRLSSSSNFTEIQTNLKYVHQNFIKSESEYYKIFHNISTYKIFDEYEQFKQNLINQYSIKIEEKINFDKNIILGVPLNLIKNVVFEQIQNNLRHADFSFPINIEITNDKDYFTFVITNNCKKDLVEEIGGGLGINLLNNLNLYPDDMIKYSKKDEENIFTQQLIIKII